MKNYNQKTLEILFNQMNEKPIVYHRIYTKITDSITAGLLLSQLVYWAIKMKYKEFYKTDKDFVLELNMGKYEFKSAKKKLQDLKIINIKKKGIPAKTYYKVNINIIIKLIIDGKFRRPTRWGKNHQLDGGKTTNWMGEKPPTITENTTENTTETSSTEEGATPQMTKKQNSNVSLSSNSLSEKKSPPEKKQELLSPEEMIEKQIEKDINEIIGIFYESDETTKNGLLFKNKNQRQAVKRLIMKYGKEQIMFAVKTAIKVRTQPYAPIITNPIELEAKLVKLKLFFDRKKNEGGGIKSDSDFPIDNIEISEREKKLIKEISNII